MRVLIKEEIVIEIREEKIGTLQLTKNNQNSGSFLAAVRTGSNKAIATAAIGMVNYKYKLQKYPDLKTLKDASNADIGSPAMAFTNHIFYCNMGFYVSLSHYRHYIAITGCYMQQR